MKKTVLFIGAMLAALVLTGCSQNADGNKGQPASHKAQTGNGDFTTPLPASKGIDEFAGKKFMAGDNIVYEFSNDGMVQSYNTNQVGVDKESKPIIVTNKDMKYAYSYNSEEKSLILVPRCFYYNDEPYYTAEEYVNAWLNPDNGNTYSTEYLNLNKKGYKTGAKSVSKYYYSFDSSGTQISLTPIEDIQCQYHDYLRRNYISLDSSLQPGYLGLGFISPFFSGWMGILLMDYTDSEATAIFIDNTPNNDTYNGGIWTWDFSVAGYAKFSYKITKAPDTEKRIKCSITDFDDNLKKYFKDMIAKVDYSKYENYNADNQFDDVTDLFKDFELTYSENSYEYTVISGTSNEQQIETSYEIDDSEVPESVNSISLSDGEWLFCRIENGLISYSSNSYKEIGEGKVYYKVTMNQGKATVTYGKATQNTTIEGSLSEYLKKYPEASEYITDGNKLKGSKELTKQEEFNAASNGFQEMLSGINEELSSLAGNGVSVKTNTARTKYKIYSAYKQYGEQTEEIWYFVKK